MNGDWIATAKDVLDTEIEGLKAVQTRLGADFERAVARRETSGGTGPGSIRRQLADLTAWLAEMR